MTDLLLPKPDPDGATEQLRVKIPTSVVVDMDRMRHLHKDYLWGCTRSYYMEMALRWFSHFLKEGESNGNRLG